MKLVRVLMLGPLVHGAVARRGPAARGVAAACGSACRVNQLVPWFILGFLALAGLRSAGVLPTAALPVLGQVSTALTIVSMAALGLGVDVRTVAKAGPAVTATVTLSLLMLLAVSLGLIRLLGI